MDAAKVLYTAGGDPYRAVVENVLDTIQNFVNDTFNAGVHQIIVTPEGVVRPAGYDPISKLYYRSTTKGDVKGNKLLNPKEIIANLQQSLYDLGDEDRPQFSDDAQIVALGFMVTAPDFGKLIPLVEGLLAVFEISELRNWYETLQDRFKEDYVDAELGNPTKTVPNWESKKLTDLSPMLKEQQKAFNKMMMTLRGYIHTADEAIIDLIDALTNKVEQLLDAVEYATKVLNLLKDAIAAEGIYVLSANTTGGTKALEIEFSDDELSELDDNGYSAAIVFVAGGPSATALATLKDLMV